MRLHVGAVMRFCALRVWPLPRKATRTCLKETSFYALYRGVERLRQIAFGVYAVLMCSECFRAGSLCVVGIAPRHAPRNGVGLRGPRNPSDRLLRSVQIRCWLRIENVEKDGHTPEKKQKQWPLPQVVRDIAAVSVVVFDFVVF